MKRVVPTTRRGTVTTRLSIAMGSVPVPEILAVYLCSVLFALIVITTLAGSPHPFYFYPPTYSLPSSSSSSSLWWSWSLLALQSIIFMAAECG